MLKPLNGFVLIRRHQTPEVSKGGVAVSQRSILPMEKGDVVATDFDKVAVGDVVHFMSKAGVDIETEGGDTLFAMPGVSIVAKE